VTALVAEKSLRIEFPDLNEPIALRADSVRLSQILVNLIINAVEFTDSGGEITIAACHSEEPVDKVPCILFSVADTGAGIPLEWQSKIFESFRQVDGSHTRTHQGTGLGLAITRQLVTLHGGRIWVKSELGEGSTFFFTIPEE
jgi:signal transduction histidine kinase